MPTIDWPVIISGLLYAALTGIFNAVFANKSQINEWAEANPRLAGLLKITRAIGLDPQHLWAAGALIVKGRLPKVQTEPLPEKVDDTVRIIPGGPLLVLLFLTFAVHQQGCSTKPLPCDESKLRAIDKDYAAKVIAVCLPKYDSKEACPEWPALQVEHRRQLREACP